ncbi:MAG TPA: hypothetical protein VK463_07675 [Desulfomonilaceae bacterium]|nr:hypothetical protein [Desulfomonilaceae bacterium]
MHHRACHEIWILKICVLLTLLAAGSLALRPHDRLPEFPLTEDGFYSLTVARNIALGRGITSDGDSYTNGFQPLFTFLTVPVFIVTGGDRYSALRGLLILHWLFYLATGYVIAAIIKDMSSGDSMTASGVFWIALSLYVGNIVPFLQHFNGLETGVCLFCYALAWRYFQVAKMDRFIKPMCLGAILGLAVLARIDAVILVIAVAGCQLFPETRTRFYERLGRSLLILTTSLVVSLPWWLYNYIYFGDLMPISGRVAGCSALSLDRAYWALLVVFRYVFPFHPTPLDGFADALRSLLLVAGIPLIIYYWQSDRRKAMTVAMKQATEFASYYGLFLALLVTAYTVYSCTIYFYGRYFAPLILLSTFGLGYISVHLQHLGRRILACVSIALSTCLICYIVLIHTGKVASDSGRSIMFHEQLGLVLSHVPEDEYVGAGQSGTLGYFRDRIVNLDGKLNHEAFRLRNVEHGLSNYLRERKITWYCDWGPGPFGDDYGKNGWALVATRGKAFLYHYTPAR